MPYKDIEKRRAWQRISKQKRRQNLSTRERDLQTTREWRKRLKDQTFEAYGGYICACCGETEEAFLQLDHIFGGGTKWRRAHGRSDAYAVYLSLRKQGYPAGYQVLCANCNIGKSLLGSCPHKPDSSVKPCIPYGKYGDRRDSAQLSFIKDGTGK